MIYTSRAYEQWAPVLGRLLMAVPFLAGAWFKMPWTLYPTQVVISAAAGIPVAGVAVALAAVLEIAIALALIFGIYTRLAAFVGVFYVLLLALIFYHNFADLNQVGMFVSHLTFIAGLLYISVFGESRRAV
jgi:uncharacterized membrane protein YphA (DoxX/SURF4 family)